MALFTDRALDSYSQRRMPQPARGDGPWGEAITYWLNIRTWRQADLVRALKGNIDKNTVSRAANGHDVNTATLRLIAAALNAPLEDVLVSPIRKRQGEELRRMAHDVLEEFFRRAERPHQPQISEAAAHAAMETVVAEAERADARERALHKSVERQTGSTARKTKKR